MKESLSTANKTRLWIDGQEILGVTSINISHSVNDVNRLALELIPMGIEIEYDEPDQTSEAINEG